MLSLIIILASQLFIGKQGAEFDLSWEEQLDMKAAHELTVSSFLKSYRQSHAFDHLSDDQMKKFILDFSLSNKQSNEEILLTAKHEGELAGVAIFEKINDETIYLAELTISPKFWRQGLGTKLIFSICEKNPAVKKIILIAENANTETHRFYVSIGFEAYQDPALNNNYTAYRWGS